ncbi:hypothetical protein [Phormidium sp. FACHB-1136]|nr:hypothetical protein [Phormidium sp. FACHB-1136]
MASLPLPFTIANDLLSFATVVATSLTYGATAETLTTSTVWAL